MTARLVRTRKVNRVEYLILSSTLDFSTDYVCAEMKKRGLRYLRLNRDRFAEYRVKYKNESLIVELAETEYIATRAEVQSVFFRSPVFIRSNKTYILEDQLYRSQWSAFIRNMTVFSDARWLNHPMFTYQAENKMYPLDIAKQIRLQIPETIVTNDSSGLFDNKSYVVKALDTPLFYEAGKEMFTYSTVTTGVEIKASSLRQAPVIIQQCLENKIDLRVTIVGNKVFSASITQNGETISGDWRRLPKGELQYNIWELPSEIEEKLLHLMKKMNLSFGGIDLAVVGDSYYFIEVNPTGEWGWIESNLGYNIHGAIVDWMVKE